MLRIVTGFRVACGTLLPWVLLALASGCAVLGPAAVKGGRTEYNIALNDSGSEELLLNIVRLRHSDHPYFLQVSSISATSEANASLGGSEDKGALGGIGYLERPNIIYIPLTGEQLVMQLLTPVELPTLQLLRAAGWEFDDILRVFVVEISGIGNAYTAASATPEGVPDYEQFLEVAEALDELEDGGMLQFNWIKQGEEEKAILHVSSDGRKTKHFNILVDSLALDPSAGFYHVELGSQIRRQEGNTIYLNPRSILASMFYLGQSIQFPPELLDSGIVNVNHFPNGEPFDWSPVFNGLMSIKVARKKPNDAFVAVAYRDHWYFIEQTDIDSKETLSMLSVLISLKAGGKTAADPVLTLPVGG